MEVIYVLNGNMERVPGYENHPPSVTQDSFGNEGFSYEIRWTAACDPKVVLRGANEVDMRAVQEIENLRG